jgi:hypothetical protein
MANNQKFPNWFLWIWEYFPILLVGALLLAMAVLGATVYVGSRLSEIEDQLAYAPPRSYQPPNLDDYSPGEMTIEQLRNRHQVYVPAYSHIYYQGGSAYALETTLSIRNVDSSQPIYVESVKYYDTDGKLAKTQVDRLIRLRPLQTIEFLIERHDSSGGSGANFLVRWGSSSEADHPLIETVMVGTAGTQGIGFSRTGIEVSNSHAAQNE